MKTISYIKHLHKAIFIALLILGLAACDPIDNGNGGGPGGGNGGGGNGGPGGNQTIELRYPGDSAEQIKTYAVGTDGTQRYKAFTFEITPEIPIHGSDDTVPPMLRRRTLDNIYPDQLEEVVLGNAMRASEAQKEVLRNLTMATFPLGLFTQDNMRPTLTTDSQMNLDQQLKLLYNEATGEVKFSIKVEERPPVGHPDLIGYSFPPGDENTDPRRWTEEEIETERYEIKRAAGTVEENVPNAVYRLAIRQDRADEILIDPLKAVDINLVFPEPVMIAGDDRPWYFIGELHKDPQCSFFTTYLEISPKDGRTNCMDRLPPPG